MNNVFCMNLYGVYYFAIFSLKLCMALTLLPVLISGLRKWPLQVSCIVCARLKAMTMRNLHT